MRSQSANSGARYPDSERVVEVHYWASARAAAGVPGEQIAVEGPVSLADLVRQITARRPAAAGLGDVLHVCSVLVDGRQVGNRDPASVEIRPGESVEFLPPFAGG